jgi:DNA-binding response OmpR family regulator
MAAPKRILIVDDDKLIHTVLQKALARAGFAVSSAYDAVQAPLVARNTKPDLVVLDIAMPGGNGYQVFERLRTFPTTALTPILVYTSASRDQIAQRIPEGVDIGFLQKPAQPDEIVREVRRLLGLPAD